MEKHVGLVAYAIQSKGPLPGGLMLEGAGYLAGALHENGYRPTIFDMNSISSVRSLAEHGRDGFLQETIETLDSYITKNDCKILGFTLYTNGFNDSIAIAKELKKRHPETTMVAGGPSVIWFEEEIMNYTDAFDVLVVGGGLQAFPKLADVVYKDASMRDVSGARYDSGKSKNKRRFDDLESLAMPIYDSDVYLGIESKIPVATLISSLGCRWGKCSFCIQPKAHGPYRERDIDDVLEEIELLESKYGITSIRLADPNPSPEHLKNLLGQLGEQTKIGTFAYSDHMYDFSKLKRNLTGIFLGQERTEGDILIDLGKTKDPDVYLEQCNDMIQEAKQHGISTVLANIVPVGNDTSERIQNHMRRVVEMSPDFITVTPLSPLPGLRLVKKIERDGDASGFRLAENFEKKLMLWELDLLQRPDKWMPPPFQIRVDGDFVENPLSVTYELFARPLAEHGIFSASDDTVLMALMYNGSLSQEQDERRKQVLEFNAMTRDALDKQDYMSLEAVLHQMKVNTQK